MTSIRPAEVGAGETAAFAPPGVAGRRSHILKRYQTFGTSGKPFSAMSPSDLDLAGWWQARRTYPALPVLSCAHYSGQATLPHDSEVGICSLKQFISARARQAELR